MPDDRDMILPPSPLAEFRLRRPPFWLVAVMLVAIVVSWLPLVVAARRRVSTTPNPPFHLFLDMDKQPRYKAQRPNPLFADGRAERPPIPGTVARGRLLEDDQYYRGYALAAGAQGAEANVEFFTGYPQQVQISEALLWRGQQQYATYCAPCHGIDGYGNGPVNARAVELQEPRWVPAASLQTDLVRGRPEGHIFNTITNGIRNMPPHGHMITVDDRWAIVAYLRALQLSQGDIAPQDPQQQQQKEQAQQTQQPEAQ
jgi:mono/diheme cytochrome c family protein